MAIHNSLHIGFLDGFFVAYFPNKCENKKRKHKLIKEIKSTCFNINSFSYGLQIKEGKNESIKCKVLKFKLI